MTETVPLWQILVASVWARHDQLQQLLDDLAAQVKPYCGSVEVLVAIDDCEQPVGVKRTRLVQAATADYVCFVDDDDRVAPDYICRAVDALMQGPDYVGFNLEYSIDGAVQKPVVHSLTNDGWSQDAAGYYRNVSHLNPIQRTAAVAALPFQPGFGEDADWAERVLATGLVRDEVYISGAPMYFYDYSTRGSLFSHGPVSTGVDPGWRERPYVGRLQ